MSNSRERTLLTLDHRTADRIPVDFWASEATIQNLENALGLSREQFLDQYDVDLRYISGPEYIGPPLENGADIWGVKRRVVNMDSTGRSEAYREVVQAPLSGAATLDQIENYPYWPDPDCFDYKVIEGQCNAVLDKDRIVVFMGDRLNRVAQLKPAMYLRGSEEIFMDIAIREQIAHTIFRKIREFYLVYLERILDSAKGRIDIVLTGDDFGAQNGLLVSPDMWRTFIKPGFADYVSLVKSHDAIAMHHTCGSVVEIIPDMIECGLDVLQSIQPEAENMSLANLKAKFGEKLCFHGGISIQKTMPFCSPDDIRQEVKAIADTVRPDGGYIFCTAHNIQADTPVENVLALMNSYLEYGKM